MNEDLLLALIALALFTLAAIVIGWLADRHLTHTARHLEGRHPMADQLPHDPYITAVLAALTVAGLEPNTSWTSDAEIDPYATGDDAGCTTMLNAVIGWDGPAVDEEDEATRDGLFLFWEHPAEHWQCARPRLYPETGTDTPEFLPLLGRYAHPDSVVATVRALLADQPVPEGYAPYWHEAGAVRAAITAWATSA